MTARSPEPPFEAAPRPFTLSFQPVALGVAAVHFAAGFTVLRRGQPGEGAYVLFRHANQLAAGRGLASHAARAEGATDFAWVVALASGRALGLDVALGALLLNTLGAFLAATVFASFLCRPGIRERWWAEAVPFLLLVSCAAAAGYVGFGTMLYGALALFAYWLFVAGAPASTLALPPTALLLALFRADGVILGAGFVALGLWQAQRRGRAGRYLRVAGAAAAVGVVSFVWRWRGFGHALAAPLSADTGGPIPALSDSAGWLLGFAGPPLAVLVTAALLLPRARLVRHAPLALGLLPFGVQLVALAFGLASPEVASGARASALLPLTLCAAIVLASELQATGWRARLGAALILAWMAAPGGALLVETLRGASADTYVERFAVQLAPLVGRGDTLALTDTGRLPYWCDAGVVDLTGHDTGEPPTLASLEAAAPDVIVLRDATEGLDLSHLGDGTLAVVPVALPLEAYVAARRRAGVAADFLSKHQDAYDVYAVRVGEGLHHVHGIRKAFAHADAVERLLMEVQRQPYQPYLALRRP